MRGSEGETSSLIQAPRAGLGIQSASVRLLNQIEAPWPALMQDGKGSLPPGAIWKAPWGVCGVRVEPVKIFLGDGEKGVL